MAWASVVRRACEDPPDADPDQRVGDEATLDETINERHGVVALGGQGTNALVVRWYSAELVTAAPQGRRLPRRGCR